MAEGSLRRGVEFIYNQLFREVSIFPLVTLRVAFGLLLTFGALRFWLYGWIDELYVKPAFHFHYFGLDMPELSEAAVYVVFMLFTLFSVLFTLGWFYRIVATLLFVVFTFIELMEVATYLNHYYFVSITLFFFIFVPAGRVVSIDSLLNREQRHALVPAWMVYIFLFQLSIVYFYAGIAKIHSDWLLEALPLKLWLPARADLPFIGPALEWPITAYVFSWFGCLYDLLIPFVLLNKRTRAVGYIAVVVFHVLTRILFPIGIFPWVMIAMTLVFFPADFHERIWKRFSMVSTSKSTTISRPQRLITIAGLTLFFSAQLLLPWRFLLQSEKLFWDELGYRFSWRVMLMEKTGSIEFRIVTADGRMMIVDPDLELNTLQLKQMATQPDLILQYAHHIGQRESAKHGQVQVFADSYVNLNGRGSRPFIDPTVDLMRVTDCGDRLTWVLPYE
ncbi:MAG: hypothetical protein RL226_1156 [Bacteroidota bacterium]|jgi:hypothetical protein